MSMQPKMASVLALVFAGIGAAAEPAPAPSPFVVRSWGTRDGLPQNTVTAIAQTQDGYLWLGTRGGLARFDGVRFRNFGLADGLQSLTIWRLVEDGQGGLWIGTVGGGLSHWRDGVISTSTQADGLAHDEVLALAPAELGSVWVGTKAGLQHCGPDGFTPVIPGAPGRVVALAADPAGGVWVTGAPGGADPVAGPACTHSLSLHDALPISLQLSEAEAVLAHAVTSAGSKHSMERMAPGRRITGGVMSSTEKVFMTDVVLPQGSVAVNVTGTTWSQFEVGAV